ncbi:hypothetical protein D1872_228040 [compost metagenome]
MPYTEIVFQLVDDEPAIHILQPQIQRDGIRPILLGKLQSPGSPGGDNSLDPFFMQHIEKNFVKLHIIFHDQKYGIPRLNRIPVIPDHPFFLHHAGPLRFSRRDVDDFRDITRGRSGLRDRLGVFLGLMARNVRIQRQIQVKDTAFVHDAVQRNFSAEQARDLPGDREPQAGSSVFPVRAAVGLLKRLENNRLFVDRDTDPRIADGEADDFLRPVQFLVSGAPTVLGFADVQ